jgi:hypothetical protein
MSIIRDLGLTLPSLEERFFVTCSTGTGSWGATTGTVVLGASGAAGISGRIFDRTAHLLTGYMVAMPFTHLYSSRGSTAPDRKITLGVKLQHGDSSGGGDMADYSTQSQPADKIYFGATARTTEYQNWTTDDLDENSTGPVRLASGPSYYDVRAAKRFLRAVHFATKDANTTESTGDEGARLSGGVTFIGGDTPQHSVKSPLSSSTSTST